MRNIATFLLLTTLLSQSQCSHPHKIWGYENNTDENHWARLSSAYLNCSTGKRQSPINLVRNGSSYSDHQFKLEYHRSGVDIVNNGHTVEFDLEEKNYLVIHNVKYELVQFHWHSHSEHTIDGKHYPLELHLVHKNNNSLAVLGVLVDVVEEDINPHFFDNIPKRGKHAKTHIDLSKLVPKSTSHYHYKGSLTTPPCSEGVKWIVFDEHIKVSKKQLKKFNFFYDHNYRKTQPIYKRQVFYNPH